MHMGRGGRVRPCWGTIEMLGPETFAVLKRECDDFFLRLVDTLCYTDRWNLEPFTCRLHYGHLRNIAYLNSLDTCPRTDQSGSQNQPFLGQYSVVVTCAASAGEPGLGTWPLLSSHLT